MLQFRPRDVPLQRGSDNVFTLRLQLRRLVDSHAHSAHAHTAASPRLAAKKLHEAGGFGVRTVVAGWVEPDTSIVVTTTRTGAGQGDGTTTTTTTTTTSSTSSVITTTAAAGTDIVLVATGQQHGVSCAFGAGSGSSHELRQPAGRLAQATHEATAE